MLFVLSVNVNIIIVPIILACVRQTEEHTQSTLVPDLPLGCTTEMVAVKLLLSLFLQCFVNFNEMLSFGLVEILYGIEHALNQCHIS
jgi:hypothetical protein